MLLKLSIILSVLLVVGLSGCTSSRVILLEGGKADSAIVVKTGLGEQVLDQPNTYTDLTLSIISPAAPKVLETQQIQQQYGQFLAATPKPPKHFLLYFEPASTVLTSASTKLFSQIEVAIRDRIPCAVNIIGHADRTGSTEYNVQLSLKRARSVETWLLGRKLEIETVTVESYGEEDPLVPTRDGVPEPKNRRVEILIR